MDVARQMETLVANFGDTTFWICESCCMSDIPTLNMNHVVESCGDHMATLAPPAPIVKSFPMKEGLDALTHELMDVAQSEAQVSGITLQMPLKPLFRWIR